MHAACLFCQSPIVWDNSVVLSLVQKRVDAKNPAAINSFGISVTGGMDLKRMDAPCERLNCGQKQQSSDPSITFPR